MTIVKLSWLDGILDDVSGMICLDIRKHMGYSPFSKKALLFRDRWIL